jgi:hypothetical protein
MKSPKWSAHRRLADAPEKNNDPQAGEHLRAAAAIIENLREHSP